MEGLGRVINVLNVADGVAINMRHAGAVTFVCQLDAGDTFTLTESDAFAGSYSTLSTVTQYYTTPKAGTGAWTKVTQAAGAVVTADTVVAAFTVSAEELSDGKAFLKCTSTSTGTVVAILHDLKVQRTPANLPVVSAA
jgi:hypothetical protein